MKQNLRKYKKYIIAAVAVFSLVLLLNFARLAYPAWNVSGHDPRNEGIQVIAYYKWLLIPDEIVFNLVKMDGKKSIADVNRYFLQFASSLKDRNFTKVYLAHRGKVKFYLLGSHFKTLGQEYDTQNPIYTIRTLPENLYLPNGDKAYSKWEGGWLGVVTKQIEDFSTFNKDWYLNDMIKP